MRQSLLTVAILLILWLAWTLRELVMLIGFAALLAYALDPVVSLAERIPLPGRRSMPRGFAAGLVMVALVLILGWGLGAAVPRLVREMGRFVDAAPDALARLDQEVRHVVASRGWGAVLGTGEGQAPGATSPLLQGARQWSMAQLGGVFGNLGRLFGLALLPVLAFYLLADREAVRSSALRFVPEDLRPQTERLLGAVDPALKAYVRGQSLICLVIGTVTGLVLALLGFPMTLFLAVMVGIAEVIPFLGFWIAAAAIGLVGYSMSPGMALAGLGAYILINSLMSYFVTPRLLGHEIKMHPFVITVSILGGGTLLGPAGGILALPAAAMAQAVIAEFAPQPRKRSA